MRRGKELRDYRNSLRRKSIEERRQRMKNKKHGKLEDKRARRLEQSQAHEAVRLGVQQSDVNTDFKSFDEYVCKRNEPIRVCHVIESLGMGGGQTMMMELILGLNKYYEGKIVNEVVCPRSAAHKYDKALFESYGVSVHCIRENKLARFIVDNNHQIMLQHRLAVSKCFKRFLPSGTKYMLMNHTYHQLARLKNFVLCDFYVSVCDYLDKHTIWSPHVNKSRIKSILNGVENEYLKDIPTKELKGDFKTGRCHRLVQSKFKLDSLRWMEDEVAPKIKGYAHYLLGHNAQAKKICKKLKSCHYIGSVLDRNSKMQILKELDCYFYETQQQEGASVAILESLACGVPVLCKNYGGNTELVKNGINGFVLRDRNDFVKQMRFLAKGDNLQKLKESTIKDFNERLHIRHAACKYMQLFEAVLR